MITIEELENMKLYKKPVFLPINKDKKKDSVIYLLTPNLRSTLKTINLPYLINRMYFQSYYMERNVNHFINSNNVVSTDIGVSESEYCNMISYNDLSYGVYLEALSTEDRNKLKDSEFGIPSLRKYPLNDAHHVRSAIRFFNYVDKENEQLLADNIKKAIKKFDVKDIGTTKENRFSLYCMQEYCMSIKENLDEYTNDDDLLSARYCQLYIRNLIKDHPISDCISFNDLEVTPDKSIKIFDYCVYNDKDLIMVKSTIDVINDFCNKSICSVMCVDNRDDMMFDGSMYVCGKSRYSNEPVEDENYVSQYYFKPVNKSLDISYSGYIDTIKNNYIYISPSIISDIINELELDINTIPKINIVLYKPNYSNDLNDYFFDITKDKDGDILEIGLVPYASDIFEDDNEDFYLNDYCKPRIKNALLSYFGKSNIEEDYNNKSVIDMKYLAKHNKYNMKKGVYSANKINRDVAKVVDVTIANPDNYNSGKDSISNATVPTSGSSGISTSNTSSDDSDNIDTSKDTKNEACIQECYNNLDLLLEDSKNDTYLKKMLYNDRIKQNKDLLLLYDQVKLGAPFIKYTYNDLSRYLNKNVFVDLSFYNELFFKYNTFKLDKGVGIYGDLLSRLLQIGKTYSRKTIFIPINDWDLDPNTKMWLYRESINPISIIIRYITNNSEFKIKELFGDNDIMFLSTDRYFKVNFSQIKIDNAFITKFKLFINNIRTNSEFNIDDTDTTSNTIDTKQAIINNITDDISKKGIDINNDTDESKMKQKDELLNVISKAAEKAVNTDDALDIIDTDEGERIKNIIINLAAEEEEAVSINNARSSRMSELNNDFLNKEIKGKSVKDILKDDTDISKDLLETTSLPISTFNDDWQNLKFINFDKNYSVDADIIEILQHLSKVSRPLSVRNIEVQDNSTSEDFVDLYTVSLEDYRGKRFTIKFDVPKFKNNKYLILRGNKKTIQSQFFNMPVLKTETDTCQIISNYKKIFVSRYGAVYGKSNVCVDRFFKTISRYEGKDLKIKYGNCTKISNRYELPIDYIDIASQVDKISTSSIIFYFNQDEIYKEYADIIDSTQGIPIAYNKKENKLLYYTNMNGEYFTFAHQLVTMLNSTVPGFSDIFENTKCSTKYLYSKCSIMSTDIPLVVVAAYSEGLSTVLKKADIKFTMKEKLDKADKQITFDYIKFKDGYIVYELNYSSSLLMNGLKDCNTEDYELKDINSKSMYVDFLDNFGGRIKADGLDNFYDCMIDPITFKVLQYYKLPTDYVSILLHANDLLADNKFIKHADATSKRLRKQELISVKVYKAIFEDAYSSYANQLKHNRNSVSFSLKQSAVIDKFMSDSTSSDLSILNALNDVETLNAITSKGESGMNSDRAYSLDKRTYDESMLNLLGMSTGFAGNVGITRQATVDMGINNKLGFTSSIKGNLDKMSSVKTLTYTEALSPMGTTRDDPFRTAMTFIQTAKHAVRTEKSDPLLVTNGSDEALPYFTSDIFAFKSKSKGKVIELEENKYMIVEYSNGEKDYINLDKTIEKNSDGGFYVTMQLLKSAKLKVGSTFKENEILAYDPMSFSNSMGETDNIAYNIGTLAKVAILNTNEGFEDSAIVSEKITKDMASKITIPRDITINKNTNVLDLIKVGTHVQEGDTLMIFQDAYEEEDVQMLLKNLNSNSNNISELGRRTIKSPVTGTVVGIKISRAVELDEMSESLRSVVKKYEAPINGLKKKLSSHKIDSASTLPSTYSLPITGKMKNAEDSVKIEIFLEYYDSLAVGDKIVYDRANKGIIKDIIPTSHHAYTDLRPNEEISAFVNISSLNSRMVTSPIVVGSLNKLMIELDRSMKDLLEIEWDDTQI